VDDFRTCLVTQDSSFTWIVRFPLVWEAIEAMKRGDREIGELKTDDLSVRKVLLTILLDG
jgi:hypothetical protein